MLLWSPAAMRLPAIAFSRARTPNPLTKVLHSRITNSLLFPTAPFLRQAQRLQLRWNSLSSNRAPRESKSKHSERLGPVIPPSQVQHWKGVPVGKPPMPFHPLTPTPHYPT